MPPKTAVATNAAPLTAADVDFLKLVFKEVKEFKVDWIVVAEKANITRSDNATTKFQNVLKKMDCRLVKTDIMTIAEAKALARAPAGKKRKAANKDDEDEDEDKGGPAAKKTKKTKKTKKAKEDEDDE